jgi:BirA family biotin operon repressor/biotin-[acetyl-CoA-carboxylase] ligase
VDGRKIAGILLETGSNTRGLWVVAGIGVNVRIAPENTGQPVTSLVAHLDTPPPSASDVCVKLRQAFAHWLDCSRTRPDELFDAWRGRADGLGRDVEVTMGEARLRGVFEDIDKRGAMLLRLPEGDLRPIWAGDVTLSRTE